MNAIQQISLKLQMGIPPEVNIQPQKLRAMWVELNNEASASRSRRRVDDGATSFKSDRAVYPSISRAS